MDIITVNVKNEFGICYSVDVQNDVGISITVTSEDISTFDTII